MDSAIFLTGAPLIAVFPMLLAAGALFVYKWRERAKNRRNPLTKSLLNAPGASLRARLRTDEDNLLIYLLVAPAFTFTFTFYIAGLIAGQRLGIESRVLNLLVILFFAAVAFFLHRMWRLFGRIRQQHLGLDGEMATGEELNQLMQLGYYVYHDIPGRNYNVDHVVVGKNGVFAFETKTHPKPAAGYKAVFDGRSIRYPDGTDSKAIEQAERNAVTLAKYLSRATGRIVHVQPIVVLPGWYVENTARPSGVLVLSSGQLHGTLPKISKNSLSTEEISAIAHQLEQLCRCETPLPLSKADTLKFERKTTI